MKPDTFFSQTNCDRCGKDLKIRSTSWFTEETICHLCMMLEGEIKSEMPEHGFNPDDFEGSGKEEYEKMKKLCLPWLTNE
jgi:hypothetical protein